MSHLAAMAVSKPLPITFSGTFSATGAGPTVTSTARTATVAPGNRGEVIVKNHNEVGAVVLEYQINAGGWVNADVNPTSLSLANGNTLQFRITGTALGESMTFDVFDGTVNSAIEQNCMLEDIS